MVQFPIAISSKEKRALKMKENAYAMIYGILFRMIFYGVLLRCLPLGTTEETLRDMHEGVCGGHFASQVTTHYIIREGFYWPTISKDAYSFIRKCPSWKKKYGKTKRAAMPLRSILVEAPFMQWGLDMIGLINTKSIEGHSYILTPTDYFTKFPKYKVLKNATTNEVITLLQENILA